MDEKRKTFALILILFGTVLVIGNFIPIFHWKIIWPILIIIVGLGMMFREIHHD